MALCHCETAWVSEVGVLEVTLRVCTCSAGVPLGLPHPGSPFVGSGQEYPGRSGKAGGSGSPVWACQVGSANLEIPWPLAAGAGAPAHHSRDCLAGREPG